MELNILIDSLNHLKVETGSLACLGCGHEHNCSTEGCSLIREAAGLLHDLNLIQNCPPLAAVTPPVNLQIDWAIAEMRTRLRMYENLGRQVTPNEEG